MDLGFLYPAVSPDSKQVAYRSGSQLVVADLKAGKTVRTFPIDGGQGFAAGWSPDGKQIGYGGWGVGDFVLFSIIDVDTGRTVRFPSVGPTMPAWSPDGSKMAFDVRTQTGWEIWIVETKTLKTLTRKQSEPNHKSAPANPDPKRRDPLTAADKPTDAAKGSGEKPTPVGQKPKQ
jgi:Tol biopolymer transport system component